MPVPRIHLCQNQTLLYCRTGRSLVGFITRYMMMVDMSPRILAPVSVLAGVHLVALRDLRLVAALVFRLFATACIRMLHLFQLAREYRGLANWSRIASQIVVRKFYGATGGYYKIDRTHCD